jgi:hypothetical protein
MSNINNKTEVNLRGKSLLLIIYCLKDLRCLKGKSHVVLL